MGGSPGLFDLDERDAARSASGDPLARLAAVVDLELFRPLLNQALCRSDGSEGGRPPIDPVVMFKILILQALCGLSDEQAEFQIRDRLSFMRFLGLDLADRVPDYSTIWRFRAVLMTAGAMEDVRPVRPCAHRTWPLGAGWAVDRRLHRRGSQATADGRGEAAPPCRRAARLADSQGTARGHRCTVDRAAGTGEEEVRADPAEP